jgi:ERCC4-type nuclease
MYIIDIRERDLIRLLTSPTTKALPIADIWIGVSNPEGEPEPTLEKGALLIERKTIRDLEASILDGRYREQKARLMAYCEEKGAIPMYILEGSYFTTSGRLGPQALMKIVARLQCKYKIAVLHTQSLAETSQVIEALHSQFQTDPDNFTPLLQTNTTLHESEPVSARNTIHVQKKANATDPRYFATASLAQCPGLSPKMAEVLTGHFKSWNQIHNATQKEIEEVVQPNGRRIGPAVAARLYELLHGEWS